MVDPAETAHTTLMAQTDAALSRSWADLARLRAVVQRSNFQVTASRIALNASRDTLRTEKVRWPKVLCEP